jgi:hypothetical protein
MSTPVNPSTPKPAGDARPAHPAEGATLEPHFGDHLHAFWQRNRNVVFVVLVVLLVGIIAKGGWDYLQEQREQEIGKAYGAATTPLQLKAFAAAHAGHPLAAAALLRVADEAYADAKYADAVAPYEQAAAVLKQGPLASRARLGAAMSKLQGGRVSDGEAALRAFAADAKELKPFRVEAAYHLATDAVANRKWEDAKTYCEQVLQIDPASVWAQRVIALRAQIPGSADAGIKVPAATK